MAAMDPCGRFGAPRGEERHLWDLDRFHCHCGTAGRASSSLFENERQISILEMQNFGRIGFVEIGALSVGRIVQVHFADKPFQRGEEKSVFRFGGSAIAVFGQAGRWRPSADVLKNTVNGIETMLRLGEEVARIS